MGSGNERLKLYDSNDNLVEIVEVPEGYMEGVVPRSIIANGKKYVEGGGKGNYYGKGQFAEVVD